MLARLAIALGALAATTACHEAKAPPELLSRLPAVEHVPLPSLFGPARLPLLPETVDGPAAPSAEYTTATRAWRTATTAYAQGDAKLAAERYLAAAFALRVPEAHPYASTFQAARCQSYENAARAFKNGRRHGEGLQRLAEISAADPACEHSVEAVASVLRGDLAEHGRPTLRLFRMPP